MIPEAEVSQWLHSATASVEVPVVPVNEITRAGRQRRRRSQWTLGVGAVLATAAVVLPFALRSTSATDSPAPTASPPASAGTCVAKVPAAVLPSWATAGFTDPHPRIPYVLGDRGDIVAILFAQPLYSPPSDDHSNKILWVSRDAVDLGQTLTITARLVGGDDTSIGDVTREVSGGPGPSIIDLPAPGCWQLTLTWGTHTDTLALGYLPG
ncbi:conserved hypothetical protein [metagenome]|uniref:Uncharacterized protein n=1 Tax=metagenome TaxID=256318 RepID=A0A2P2CFR8_9ZZZZ